MTCAVCGASIDRDHRSCPICGAMSSRDAGTTWDRRPEALAYEDLAKALHNGESLLALTRGRVAGAFRRRLTLQPQVMLSPYVNVGLTDGKLLIQPIHPGSGRAGSDGASTIPAADIVTIQATDADLMEPGRTVRLAIRLRTGEGFRVRASGRLAESARELAKVWDALTAGRVPSAEATERCPGCGRALDREYRFCPYCGHAMGAGSSE